METPGERPPTRLRVVCQEGWDGARRHPQPAAGVQSAEQWCSSQSQPQPQLRYQQPSSWLPGPDLPDLSLAWSQGPTGLLVSWEEVVCRFWRSAVRSRSAFVFLFLLLPKKLLPLCLICFCLLLFAFGSLVLERCPLSLRLGCYARQSAHGRAVLRKVQRAEGRNAVL